MSITANDILAVTQSVTKEWTKHRKAEERGRRSREARQYIYSDRVNFTDVADAILPEAYAHASGGGNYSVSKRQFFYACRDQFKERTDRELEYGYFAGTLLVQYMNRHPESQSWRVTADPRGALVIPNAGHDVRIPCGTLAVDDHLAAARIPVDALDIDATLRTEWPSLAAGQRYQAMLYIEKEGFEPLIKEERVAERFDLLILSCKGQSVVAARRFVDEVCAVGNGVPLLVAHDMDKSGFEISQRLTSVSDWAEENDRVTYQFQNEIHVIDLGLRLVDARRFGLKGESCRFKGGFASDSIATEKEKAFLRSGRRIELNEFTSPQFLQWLEEKLTKYLPVRLIPTDDVLRDAYRRALAVAQLNATLEAAKDAAIEDAENAEVPDTLRSDILNAHSEEPWDKVLYDIAKSKLSRGDGED